MSKLSLTTKYMLNTAHYLQNSRDVQTENGALLPSLTFIEFFRTFAYLKLNVKMSKLMQITN